VVVQVSVSAAVKVTKGPQLSLDLTLDPESYTLHSSRLGEAGAANGADKDEHMLPDGTIVLLAVTAVDTETKPAKVELTLREDTKTEMTGALLVANADAVEQLVTAENARLVKFENKADRPVTVEILTCRDGEDE
jgi:hypothetical protein